MGAPNHPFDPFFGGTVLPLIPSPPRTERSALPYPDDLPPPLDYNILFAERIAVGNRDPNLRTGSKHRPTIGITPHVREGEPTAPELPTEEQIRFTPTLGRVFPKAGDWFGKNMVNGIGIDQDSREFLDYLQDEICENLMKRNKITRHVETGNIYL